MIKVLFGKYRVKYFVNFPLAMEWANKEAKKEGILCVHNTVKLIGMSENDVLAEFFDKPFKIKVGGIIYNVTKSKYTKSHGVNYLSILHIAGTPDFEIILPEPEEKKPEEKPKPKLVWKPFVSKKQCMETIKKRLLQSYCLRYSKTLNPVGIYEIDESEIGFVFSNGNIGYMSYKEAFEKIHFYNGLKEDKKFGFCEVEK